MNMFSKTGLLLCLFLIAVVVHGKDTSFTVTKTTSTTASFIPGAVPAVGRSNPAPTEVVIERTRALNSGYGLYNNNNNNNNHHRWTSPSPPSTTQLFGKKKKKGGGGGGAATKVQVKLLKHIAGTGQAGDVIQVTPAFYNNKLRPTKSAELISDDQLEKEQAERAEKEEATQAQAKHIQELLSDELLRMERKAGPTGQLFGGIHAKNIVEEIETNIIKEEKEKEFLMTNKGVKITALKDKDGKKLRGDIKHVGTYSATLALTKGISAELSISVEPIEA